MFMLLIFTGCGKLYGKKRNIKAISSGTVMGEWNGVDPAGICTEPNNLKFRDSEGRQINVTTYYIITEIR